MYLPKPSEALDETWLNPVQIAKYLKISKMTVYRAIERGDLKAVRFGRSYRITQKELTRYLRNLNGPSA